MTEHTRWAECVGCHHPMAPGSGCTITHYDDIGGTFARIPFGEDDTMNQNMDMEHCPDCNAGRGKLHHVDCDREECPRCHRQAFGCDCIVIPEGATP